MPNPFGDEPVNKEAANPFGDTPVSEGVVDNTTIQTEPEFSSRKTDLPLFSSEDIMQGINEGGLSENAINAANELMKRGRIGEGTIPYLESLKMSRLKKDVGSLDQPATPPGIDLWEMATGEKRKTELTEKLPEFRETAQVQDPQIFDESTTGGGFIESLPSLTDRDLGLTAGLMFSLTDQDSMDIIKEAIPDAEFIKDEKGNVIVEVDGQLSVLNKPGWSKQDSVKAVTQFLSFLTPAKMASLGPSLLAKVGIGAVTSGLTEAGIQEIQQATGVTKERDAGRIATATALGGAAELIGPAYKAQKQFRADRALKKTGEGITDVPETIRTAKEAVEGVKEFTGVDVPLYKPQQTLTPSDTKLMQFLPQLDATSQKASAALTKQSKKVKEAVDNAVEYLTPDEVMNAPEGLRTAAERAIKSKKLIRNELTSDLFNEANPIEVDVSSVVKLIDDEMKPFIGKSNVKTQLEKIKGNIVKEDGNPTILELKKAKANIEEILNVNTGDSVLKGDNKRIVTKVKEELLTAMDGAGATTPKEAKELRGKVKGLMERVQKGETVTPEEIAELPAYGQGRIKFAQASPEVAALEKGLVGKLAKANDLQVEQIANSIFDPKLRSQTIKNAKTVLDGVDPEIFPQILKFKMLDNLSKMKAAKSGSIENVASKTRTALFGNNPNKEALMAAMTTEQKRNFNYLDEMLARASEGRSPGSPTASFQELMKNIKSVPMFLQKLMTVNIGEVRNVGKQGVLDMRLKALAKTVYDDSWASELTRVREMNPNTAAAGKAFAQLLDNIGIKEE